MDCLTGVLVCDISIHAPRTGSDAFPCLAARAYSNFNPRSPHGERLPPTCARNLWRNFNPRSPHGERQDRAFLNRRIEISIHAPRTGSDAGKNPSEQSAQKFQSTLPARGATDGIARKQAEKAFQSTLPARGATKGVQSRGASLRHFNPRSPHGERRYNAIITERWMLYFNPRSPHGERPPPLVI